MSDGPKRAVARCRRLSVDLTFSLDFERKTIHCFACGLLVTISGQFPFLLITVPLTASEAKLAVF